MNPLWIVSVIAGWDHAKDESFLGMTTMHGLKIEDNYFATALAGHYCPMVLATDWKENMSE